MIRRVLIAVMAVALFGFGPVLAQPSTPPTVTAAQVGQGVSEYAAGLAAYERDDFATALRYFGPLADQGDAYTQTNLGVMYVKGQKACRRTSCRLSVGSARRLNRGMPQRSTVSVLRTNMVKECRKTTCRRTSGTIWRHL